MITVGLATLCCMSFVGLVGQSASAAENGLALNVTQRELPGEQVVVRISVTNTTLETLQSYGLTYRVPSNHRFLKLESDRGAHFNYIQDDHHRVTTCKIMGTSHAPLGQLQSVAFTIILQREPGAAPNAQHDVTVERLSLCSRTPSNFESENRFAFATRTNNP